MKKAVLLLSFVLLFACNKQETSQTEQNVQNNSGTTKITAVITNNSSKSITEIYSVDNSSDSRIDWNSVKPKSKNLLNKKLSTNETITFTFDCNNEKGFLLGIFDGENPTESGGLCCANYKATLKDDGFSGGCE